MVSDTSGENSPTSSSPEPVPQRIVCVDPQSPGQPCPICGGIGVVKHDTGDINDPHFGKLFRCPNYPVEADVERQQRLLKLSNLDTLKDKSFENFTTALSSYARNQQESLQHALNTAVRFAQSPDGWLLLSGGYGSGKTHLAAAIGHVRISRGDSVLFVTTPDLLDYLRTAYSPTAEASYDETFERVRDVQLLILDDLGVENPSAWAQEKLFQLLNHRYLHRRPTVITTNVDPEDLDPRIRSRLYDVHIVQRIRINAPDFRRFGDNVPLVTDLSAYQQMRFETFDVRTSATRDEADNLKRALGAARDYAQNPSMGWVIFSGKHGCGKTHLAAAIANARYEMGEEVMFVTVPDLLDYLRQTFDPGSPARFDKRFHAVRSVKLLVLDDLSATYSSSWVKEKLFQILDYRYVRRLPTVITTVHSLSQEGEMDARIMTRLLDRRVCMPFAITADSYVHRTGRNK